MKFGLTKKDLSQIQKVIEKFHDIESVMVFGSRAMGHFKEASDVDLALMGPVNDRTLTQVKMILNEELNLPYFFDVVIYNDILKPEFKQHIDQEGKILYRKELPIHPVPRRC